MISLQPYGHGLSQDITTKKKDVEELQNLLKFIIKGLIVKIFLLCFSLFARVISGGIQVEQEQQCMALSF